MLTAEIRVNGSLIGHLSVVNLGEPTHEGTLYVYRYIWMDTADSYSGRVRHHPDDGAEVLIRKILHDALPERP